MRRMKKKITIKKRLTSGLILLIAGAIAVAVLIPFVSVVLHSFVAPNAIRLNENESARILFLPYPISMKQYLNAILYDRETLIFFWNTVGLTVPILAGGMVVSILSGYGLAKFQFPFKRVVLFTYILVMLLPVQINVVGSYLFFDKLKLIGSRLGVILPGIFSSFGAFLMYQFMKGISDETLESARLDGANELQILIKIVIPQVKSGIASMLILMLIDCWNMVEMPMSILKEERLYPLSIMLRYIGNTDPGIIYAATVVFSIPLLLVFFMAQEQLTEGIKRSGQINLGTVKK